MKRQDIRSLRLAGLGRELSAVPRWWRECALRPGICAGIVLSVEVSPRAH
jgi:hypothetical protein